MISFPLADDTAIDGEGMPVRDGTVLVADDDPGICRLLEQLLGNAGFEVVTTEDSLRVPALVRQIRPDTLLLDVQMPGIDGITLCQRLKADETTREIPVLLMTATTGVEDIQAQSQADAILRKPFDRHELIMATRCFVRVGQLQLELHGAETLLVSMSAEIEGRSRYPQDHVQRVAELSVRLASSAGLDADAIDLVRRAALLHDIGTIGVPERILQKRGRLTEGEFEKIKQHTILGAALCRSLHRGHEISALVRGHHERWDGKGYPDGLAAEDIPLGARVIAVADAFDAHSRDRPYRAALPVGAVLDVLWHGAGSQWDPRLVELFSQLIPRD